MYGAAVYLNNSAAVFRECVFSGNSAYTYGGAFSLTGASSTPLLENCVIEFNQSGNYGGAIYTTGSAHAKLVNTLFRGNFSGNYGGAVYAASTITMTNVTITGNSAIASGGGIYQNNGTVTLNNSILWGNQANVDSDAAGTITGTNNHIGGGSPGFAGSGDFPYSLAAGSPCTGAGDNNLYEDVQRPGDETDADLKYNDLKDKDLAGKPRKVGVIDIGAYERQ
jgi:predicted outer membrane repeat protein